MDGLANLIDRMLAAHSRYMVCRGRDNHQERYYRELVFQYRREIMEMVNKKVNDEGNEIVYEQD